MFYITGDTHIPLDSGKLLPENFKEGSMLDENDYLIILGDFGGVWDNKSPEHKKWLDFLASRRYTTLFIDGNHENFDILNSMDVDLFCGGKVHKVRENVLHLMRGQVYNIDGTKFFCFGGGFSKDRDRRLPHISWWQEEMPNDKEYEEGLKNLKENGYMVDYILTHTAPLPIISQFFLPFGETKLNNYLSEIDKLVSYKKWYFGHVHKDMEVDDRHTALYEKIIELGENL